MSAGRRPAHHVEIAIDEIGAPSLERGRTKTLVAVALVGSLIVGITGLIVTKNGGESNAQFRATGGSRSSTTTSTRIDLVSVSTPFAQGASSDLDRGELRSPEDARGTASTSSSTPTSNGLAVKSRPGVSSSTSNNSARGQTSSTTRAGSSSVTSSRTAAPGTPSSTLSSTLSSTPASLTATTTSKGAAPTNTTTTNSPGATTTTRAPGATTTTTRATTTTGSGATTTGPAATTTTTSPPSGWRTSVASPLNGRYNENVIWTGTELFVQGGFEPARFMNDGAAYNPTTNTWRTIPAAPWSYRDFPNIAWTGIEVVMWGGEVGNVSLNDGVAYKPSTNTWRTLPASPLSARYLSRTFWTGSEVLIWGGLPFSGGDEDWLMDGAAYNPTTNTWRMLPPADMPRAVYGAAWTGTEMVLVRGSYTGEGAYNPSTNTWRSMASAANLAPGPYPYVTWTGTDVVSCCVDQGAGSRIDAYRPATDSWIKGIASTTATRLSNAFVFGGGRLWIHENVGGQAGAIQSWNATSGAWTALPTIPVASATVRAWTGSELLAWNGHDSSPRVALYRP